MLRFVFTDTQGIDRILSSPLSLTIRMDEDVPADDFEAVFAGVTVDELAEVRVYDDDGAVFVGVVDDQERLLTERGAELRISARSLAARLLDNEAVPQCYDHPSASLIYERHVLPYGIEWENDGDATCFGEQQVSKGMSQWAVLKNFCNACFSAAPRITSDGVLRMNGSGSTGAITFSDDGDGVAYYRLSEIKRRCEEISCIHVKAAEDEGYCYTVANPDAVSRGVRRERYLNASLTATPMTCADTMMANAAKKAYGVQLMCAGCLLRAMGNDAVVINRLFGKIEGLYVSGIRYRLTEKGDDTTLQLKRRKNECGYQDM